MKKILMVLLTLRWSIPIFALCNGTVEGHTSMGTYNGYPVYVVKNDETLNFGFDCFTGNATWLCYFIDGVNKGKCPNGLKTSTLSSEKFYNFHLRKSQQTTGNYYQYDAMCYIIINTPSQSTCSSTEKQITIWVGKNISRWERSYDGGSTWTNIACTEYQYTESSPEAGTAMYRVLGTDGTYSDIVTITYVDAVPSTIQALPATSTKTVEESITLTADVEDDNYSYQWMKDGKNISGATSSTYTISSIKSADAGNYTCSVSNGCNEVITTTADLSVNKCAQVIDFPEIPVQTYSPDLTYSLPEKTNKGLTITYQSMNTSVATVSGNILTIVAPGTAIISATQVGNNNYLEAAKVSRTLTVNKRTQTIVFDELPVMTYEDLPFTLPQKTDEGLTISYTSSNTSVATVSGNTVTILKPGATDIIASQEGDATHYSAAEVSQTLVVKKAVQEISFGALDAKTYGDAPFTLNEVSNKNLTITYTSSDASIASISGNTVTINKPGTLTITAAQAGNAYYLAAEPVSQSLTINKANQTINFPALESRAFGSGDFELEKSTDRGLDIVYASNNPAVVTISDNVVHIVGAGNAVITATQEGNDYYNAAPVVAHSLTITKAIQTIDFPELPTCVYGQTPITLNASVNSGLEIEYESSDYSVATINGNELTIVGAGQCYITASVYGNKNYYTATPVERTLVVNKAQPTIIFAPLTDEYTYGDDPIALVASGSYGDITFTSSDPSRLMIIETNAIIQGAGQFTITASLEEDANHMPASVAQTIVVQKANLIATANNASRVYGDKNPEFTYTLKGFVNGDSKSDLTAAIQAESEATITSPVGAYEIAVTATTDDNYNIVCKRGTLTIGKAPLTVSAEEISREYGEDNPEYEFVYSGFKNDESSTIFSTTPQAYTTAKKTSPTGTYPIYISGAKAVNYDISYIESSLSVTKAPLNIKVLDATRKRLEENPQFSLNITGFKLEETVDDLEKLPTIQCEANSSSPAGIYPIVLLNDGYATNYDYLLTNGTLTVEKLRYTINVTSEDITKGSVTGGGVYDEDEIITLSATAMNGYHFTQWSDGNKQNPRTFMPSSDATYIAQFAIDVTGSCGDDNLLTWRFDSESKTLVISGNGALNSNYTFGLEAPTQTERLIIEEGVTSIGDYAFKDKCATVTSVALPSTVTSIGDYAFAGLNNRKFNTLVLPNTIVSIGAHAFEGASYLQTIHFGSVLEEIGDYAFNGCTRVKKMTCLAEVTPNVGTSGLTSISDLAELHVPNDYLLEYQIDNNWKRFVLKPIGATEATITNEDVQIEADDNTATITWPTSEADSYTIEITKDGEVFCRLIFNANGQLTGIAFAPSRDGQSMAPAATMTAAGMQFTVTGLNSGTSYGYMLEAKSGDTTVASYSGSFATTGGIATSVDEMNSAIAPQKVMRDGQVLIFRDGKTYNLQGQEVK